MENLEKQLKNASNIRMTESEHSFMRSNIISFINIHDIRQGSYIKSPYRHFWNPLLVTLCSIMFIIASGGTISYNATDALPGDKLWQFKIINEEVQGILITSPTEKIMWQQNRVAERINEVKQLAATDKLTTETAAIAERAIEKHIAKIDEDVQILAKENPDELTKTAEALNTIIASHDQDLQKLVEIEDVKQEAKDAIQKIELKKIEDTSTKTPADDLNTLPTTNTGVIPITSESLTTAKIPAGKEPKEPMVLEKSVSSVAVTNIISKIKKESESINEISNPNANTTPTDIKNTDKIPTIVPVKSTQ